MPSNSPNGDLLEEVAAAGAWFRARKTRPIWARRVETPERVRTLEADEDVPAGSYVCRGEAGDIWPQSSERLAAKYAATDEVSADGWTKYLPNPDSEGVWAARVDRPFEVRSSWGRLSGKPGDYVVKDFDQGAVPYPADVWIVDAKLFAATYEAV